MTVYIRSIGIQIKLNWTETFMMIENFFIRKSYNIYLPCRIYNNESAVPIKYNKVFINVTEVLINVMKLGDTLHKRYDVNKVTPNLW